MSTIEQCAICMENFAQQEVGIPENCEHSFCLACILEWAKVILPFVFCMTTYNRKNFVQKNNSCPIDRKVFLRILKKHSYTSTRPYDTVCNRKDDIFLFLKIIYNNIDGSTG